MGSCFVIDGEGHSILPTLQIWIRLYSLLWWMMVRPTTKQDRKKLVILRGKGLRIKAEEKRKWDKRVKKLFQKNAWCDEKMMKEWTANEWANYFTNHPTPRSSSKILVADVHRAQQTANVKNFLQNKSTLSMPHQTIQAEFSHSIFLSTSHLKMQFGSSSRNTSTFTPKINYLSQKEECLLQNWSRKVGKKYRETKKL